MESKEKLEKLKGTLEKYRKNKPQISSEDLAGKYKTPFARLEQQLKSDLCSYLKAYSLENLVFLKWTHAERIAFAEDVNWIYHGGRFGERVGRAALKEFDLDRVRELADELRGLVVDAWAEYAERHMDELVSSSR